MDKENHLKRETPFQCHISFCNTLPEVPADPKLMVVPLEEQELAAFKLTSLERNPRHALMLDPARCCPVSLLDIERWIVPPEQQEMAPEDVELMGDEATTPAAAQQPGSAARSMRPAGKGGNAQLSWLVRTTYIAGESKTDQRQHPDMTDRDVKRLEEKLEEEELLAGDLDTQLAAAQASFDRAQEPPVHPTKPHLKPQQILPVLPDEDDAPYVHMLFDDDPTAEHPRLSKLPAKHRQCYSEAALLKSYNLEQGERALEKFLALLMPKQLPADLSRVQGDRTEEYEWVREYAYELKLDDPIRTWALRRRKDYMGYLPLGTRLPLVKRGKLIKSSGRRQQAAAAMSKPSKGRQEPAPADHATDIQAMDED